MANVSCEYLEHQLMVAQRLRARSEAILDRLAAQLGINQDTRDELARRVMDCMPNDNVTPIDPEAIRDICADLGIAIQPRLIRLGVPAEE